METTMWYRLSIAASAVLMMGTITANAAELPTYETGGFPLTPHQMAALGAANAQQQAPTATPELAGLPASPLQIAVLARHDQKTTRSSARTTTGLANFSPAVATEQSR
jgi:hypothetical protein